MKSWITALAVCAACMAAAASDADTVASDLGVDRAIAGGQVSQMRPVAGDLMAAGGTVDVLGAVAGDAMLAGGTLRVDGAVGQSLYAAGGRLTLAAAVQRNVRIAGGTLEIAPSARVAGNVSAAGGEVRVLGPIGGYLSVAAGRVLIDAAVAGDVDVRAGRVELGPHAAIAGKLRYTSPEELVRDPAAQVSGGVERSPAMPSRSDAMPGAFGGIWTAGLMVLAAVLAAALPTRYERMSRTLAARPGMSAFAGFVVLVCLPVLAIVLLVTIVGVPLGLLTLLAYPILLLLAYVSVAVMAGRIALARWKPDKQAHRGWQAGVAAACMLALAVMASVPWIGALVVLAALFMGLGSLFLTLRAAW
jgi:hypothetical protein